MINKLFLISGHSGSGKSTIMKSLMDNEIISFTTREKRQGEREGVDYKFISLSEFNKLKKDNKLVEYVEYHNNFYGLDEDEIKTKLDKYPAFCIVDYHGMNQLKEYYPNCTSIFLYTPHEQAYKQMLSRGDSEDNVLGRLSSYEEEMGNRNHYDYVIKNNFGKLENTKDIIWKIIMSEVDE